MMDSPPPRGGSNSLGSKAARGAATMLLGQLSRVVVQMLSVVVLGRLLSPSDFGVLAMVTAVVGVGGLLRDFGLGQAAIQAKSISTAQKSNLFWLNSAVGLSVALIAFWCAPLISSVYRMGSLAPVVQALSIVFLLGGMATQFRAELSRNMQFRRVIISEASAQAVGVCLAVGLAVLGFGYWALVAQQLADATIVLILSAVLSRWWPHKPSRQPMSLFLRYGWGLLGTQVILYISQNIDSFLIGRRYGATTLGEYNRAFQLLMLPLNQISAPATKVALPVLSRLRDEPIRFDDFLLRANLLVGGTVIVGLSFAASQSHALVLILLGPQWGSAADLFRLLAIAGCFQALSYAVFWVFLASGKTTSNLKFTLITRSCVAILVILGSQYSVEAVAVGYSLGLALSWPSGLLWIRKWGPARRLAIQGFRLLVYGSYVAAASYATLLIPGISNPVVELLLGGCGAIIALVIAFFLFRPMKVDTRSMVHTWNLLKGTGRAAN
ncbi:lipopolysaccharide biosynthesis protein [Microbacterium horticulturae]|uniref:lipopolysaccharide biosynthesis protein n=1 Tax=Microbacterium horticulturae TaxID=3028316 RepID=UPI003D165252